MIHHGAGIKYRISRSLVRQLVGNQLFTEKGKNLNEEWSNRTSALCVWALQKNPLGVYATKSQDQKGMNKVEFREVRKNTLFTR